MRMGLVAVTFSDYLNTPSRAGPSSQTVVENPTTPLTMIDVSVIYSDPPLWLIYLLVACLWGYVGWKCNAVHRTRSGGGNNYVAWFLDAIYGSCWKDSSPFSNVHFRNTTKIAAQVLCS